jgi:hypothetical protein
MPRRKSAMIGTLMIRDSSATSATTIPISTWFATWFATRFANNRVETTSNEARAAGPINIAEENITIAPANSKESKTAILKIVDRYLRSDLSPIKGQKMASAKKAKKFARLIIRENATAAAAPRKRDIDFVRRDAESARAENEGFEGFVARAMFQLLIVSGVSTNVELLSAFPTRS